MHEMNPQELVGVVQPVEPIRNYPPSLFSTASMSLGVRGWDARRTQRVGYRAGMQGVECEERCRGWDEAFGM